MKKGKKKEINIKKIIQIHLFDILYVLSYNYTMKRLRKEAIRLERDEVIEKLKMICMTYADILGMVILFGSYSRNEATVDSDIDLYIEPKEESMTTNKFGSSKRYKEFKYALYDSFSTNFDLLAYGGKRDLQSIRRSPIWKQIDKDGIVIYGQR